MYVLGVFLELAPNVAETSRARRARLRTILKDFSQKYRAKQLRAVEPSFLFFRRTHATAPCSMLPFPADPPPLPAPPSQPTQLSTPSKACFRQLGCAYRCCCGAGPDGRPFLGEFFYLLAIGSTTSAGQHALHRGASWSGAAYASYGWLTPAARAARAEAEPPST